jgi:hypothetical protein
MKETVRTDVHKDALRHHPSPDEAGSLVMTTQTLKAKLSHSTAATQQEQGVGNNDVDRASSVMPATTIPPEHRCEVRVDDQSMCSYEVLEAIDEELVIMREGKAFTLNQSTKGILLFMGLATHTKQLI